MQAEGESEEDEPSRKKWGVTESRVNLAVNKEMRKRGLPMMTTDQMLTELQQGEEVVPEGSTATVAKKRRGGDVDGASKGEAEGPSASRGEPELSEEPSCGGTCNSFVLPFGSSANRSPRCIVSDEVIPRADQIVGPLLMGGPS